MEIVKAIKQGNAIMLILSSKLGVEEGQEFYYHQDSEGIISLISKAQDYFMNVKAGEYVDEEDSLAKDYSPKGIEVDD